MYHKIRRQSHTPKSRCLTFKYCDFTKWHTTKEKFRLYFLHKELGKDTELSNMFLKSDNQRPLHTLQFKHVHVADSCHVPDTTYT